jgi:hypothetical protein
MEETHYIYQVLKVNADGTYTALETCPTKEAYLTLKAAMPAGVEVTAQRIEVPFDPRIASHLS